MGYRASGRLQDMISVEATEKAVKAIAQDGLAFAEDAIRDGTPVYVGWPRPGRDPGHLRRSIHRTRFVRRVTPFAIEWRAGVETDDPVGPHVEYDTRPHEIRPRVDRAPASVLETGKPRGTVQDGRAALAWHNAMGALSFARVVQHPGTKGQHMFARGAVKTERSMASWAAKGDLLLRLTITKGEGRR